MKKEFIRNGVKFTMEIVDWKSFNELIMTTDDSIMNDGDWSTEWHIREQLLEDMNDHRINVEKHNADFLPEELWAEEICYQNYLYEWDKTKRRNNWIEYFQQRASLADESAFYEEMRDAL